MMDNLDDLFVFRPFRADDSEELVKRCYQGAMDKLQTLCPGKPITSYGYTSLSIPTDSYYSETGSDMYELGLVDGEIPAMRNMRDSEVITYRID